MNYIWFLLLVLAKLSNGETEKDLVTCKKILPQLEKYNHDIESCEDRFGNPIITYGSNSGTDFWTCDDAIKR